MQHKLNSPHKPQLTRNITPFTVYLPNFREIFRYIAIISFFGALIFCHGCASTASSSPLGAQSSVPALGSLPNDSEIDEESGFTNYELRTCKVIVESNQESCGDSEGDMAL